ncbi:hypothetical protein [Merismopedia glauca]|uniref:Zinc ribbon domain-containing protein n=1 Tax=Merismopedia glauca CCAP 1448/3 TaxID=1296344 RepID=A0A2T1BYR4_9CYAN|nr:hypothetical protein [Merismopedia glauca]PSB01084.1 hypothetical protein C7B64_20155 [Merismopedia glauca CCAP 1448/3]
MALVPCKECGTLNSSDAEICLSCEYPIRGRSKTNWLKWVAIILALMLGLPVVLATIDIAKTGLQPQSSQPTGR